jgi:hypothetical protein
MKRAWVKSRNPSAAETNRAGGTGSWSFAAVPSRRTNAGNAAVTKRNAESARLLPMVTLNSPPQKCSAAALGRVLDSSNGLFEPMGNFCGGLSRHGKPP